MRDLAVVLGVKPKSLAGMVLAAVGLIVFIAGIRFSDGSMLLAIARGAAVDDPAFAKASSQYVWDSPLKICLLRALPARTAVIAIVFAALSLLPLLGLLAKDAAMAWAFTVAIFLTPAFRIAIQNMGLGDGIPITCMCLTAATRRTWVVASMFFIIALWHPQQSFFMGISYLVALYCFSKEPDVPRAAATLTGLILGAAVFFTYKALLGFSYSGRAEYMAENARLFIGNNISYAPLAFAPLGLWLLVLSTRPVRGWGLLAGWLAVLAAVSLLTTDVTRAMTIVSLPIVLVAANLVFQEQRLLEWRKYALAALVLAVIPAYSWSGVDFFLWHDLIKDLRKWGFVGDGGFIPAGF